MYLPDNIGERPWPMALLQSLAAGLRKMAGELDSSDKGGLAMSNVVEFPTTEKPITEDEIDKLHSGAFRDLESGISDCVHMASIAVQMAEHAIEGRDDKHEKAMFAVFQVTVVLKKLKADYYAAWHGERRST
jgi:hypothetical protein